MSTAHSSIDLDEVVKVLASLGIDEASAREQFAAAESSAATIEEIAALSVESEAGLLLPLDIDLDTALFELGDALRQAGVSIALGQCAQGPALRVGARVFEVRFLEGADTQALLQAVAGVVPSTHQILRAQGYDAGEVVPLVLLDRASLAWLSAAVGGDELDRVLQRVTAASSSVELIEISADSLLVPDFAQRFHTRVESLSSRSQVDEIWQRVRAYDARLAWPEGFKRPPGDDLYELSTALSGEPLKRALSSADPVPLANLLYQFALVTSVGAHWDVLAARQNPGMSAQGVLGLGQLTWSWFIFAALGATQEEQRVARVLDSDWVRVQERGNVTARQRAWFDLGAFLRHGKRGPALGRLLEILPLFERSGFQDPQLLTAALAMHSEPRGDQLTHQPLFYTWPAPLYVLAARAGAMDLLPAHDAFLSRPLQVELVDQSHELVVWLHKQLATFESMDESRLPPLLDPLPVIVDVRITEVDATQAHGRTLLAARDDAEHHVVAPHAGRTMRAGEVWLFEISGSRQTRARARFEDLGEVAFHIALPTGAWLHRVEPS